MTSELARFSPSQGYFQSGPIAAPHFFLSHSLNSSTASVKKLVNGTLISVQTGNAPVVNSKFNWIMAQAQALEQAFIERGRSGIKQLAVLKGDLQSLRGEFQYLSLPPKAQERAEKQLLKAERELERIAVLHREFPRYNQTDRVLEAQLLLLTSGPKGASAERDPLLAALEADRALALFKELAGHAAAASALLPFLEETKKGLAYP